MAEQKTTETKDIVTKATETKETVKISGKLLSAYTHQESDEKTGEVKQTNILSISTDGVNIDGAKGEKFWAFFDALYEGVKPKWIPDWYKDRSKGKVTFKSRYNIAVKIDDTDERMSFAQFVERGLIRNADVTLKLNVKDNTLYPSALLINEDGEVYDAFENF